MAGAPGRCRAGIGQAFWCGSPIAACKQGLWCYSSHPFPERTPILLKLVDLPDIAIRVQSDLTSVLTCSTNRAVSRLHQLHSRQVAAYTASRCDGRPWIAGSSGFRLVLDQSNFALNVSEASQNGIRFINTHRQVPNDRFVSLCFA